jgi:hypothetical protein
MNIRDSTRKSVREQAGCMSLQMSVSSATLEIRCGVDAVLDDFRTVAGPHRLRDSG